MKHISESIIGKRGQRLMIDDLKDKDIIVLRSGLAMLIHNNEARVMHHGAHSAAITPLKEFINPDLTAKTDRDNDIMKVYRVERTLEPDLLDFDYTSTELLNLIDNIQHGKFKGTKIYLKFERK